MTAEQLISFARGAPSLDIVDVEGLKAAAVRAFDADPAGVTAYGTSVGYLPLRKWIAEKHGVEADQVLVTNGSLQADAFLFDHLVRPGDAVVVERPTYDRTLLNLQRMGSELHGIAVQPDGLDTAELRKLLESGVRPRLAHVIPNYQNPAGMTLSLEKRRELLDLAAEYEFTIFEDDPYADIRFRGEALPSMLSLDTRNVVVHASSFTKTVCPGVRVGYLVGPADLIADIAKNATSLYISPGMVSQAIVHQFCVSGDIDRSIETVRAALGERAQVLAESLRRHLPQARVRGARRRLLPLGGVPGGRAGRPARPGGGRARGRRGQGQRLRAGRWAARSPAGLLGGDRRPDRRGCPSARGGRRGRPQLT